MSLKIREKFKFTSVLLVSAMAVACGGESSNSGGTNPAPVSGGGDAPVVASAGTVSVLITDNLTDQYTKVWVSVLKVVLVAADGTEVNVFESAEGQLYNLRELSEVAELLTSAMVPAGSYRGVKITVDNDAQLVDAEDKTLDAKFSLDAEQKEFFVRCELDVTADDTTALAIDFDLARFTYDPATGLLRAKIVAKNEHDVGGLEHVGARLRGAVLSVEDGDTFVLLTRHRRGEQQITVNLAANSVVGDPATGENAADTSILEANDRVEVKGSFDPATLTVEAQEVYISDAPVGGKPGGDGADKPGHAHVVGTVKSFDGQNLVVDVKGANFKPGSAELTISNVANAFFARGSLETLAVEQQVEVKGSWDGTTFTAKAVVIQGAEGKGENYAQLKAKVLSMADGSITVSVIELKGSDATLEAGTELTLAIEDTFFHRGSQQCLAVDAEVMVRGAYDGTAFTANGIHVLGDCNQPGDMGKPGWSGGTPRGGKAGGGHHGKPRCEVTPVESPEQPVAPAANTLSRPACPPQQPPADDSQNAGILLSQGSAVAQQGQQPPVQQPGQPGSGRGGKGPKGQKPGHGQPSGGKPGVEQPGVAYTRVMGVVQSISDKLVTVATVNAEGVADGKVVTVDITNAKVKGAQAIAVGATVRAVGTLSGETLVASAYMVEPAA